MTSNIFEQSFDQLLNSVGASPAQPVQQAQQAPVQPSQQAPAQPAQQAPVQPIQQAPAQPVQQAPVQPAQQASVFDQFTMPTVVADEMKAQADTQPASNTDAYQVDVDIFGAQDVPPTVAPSNVTQEQTESSTSIGNTETDTQAPVEEPAPVKEEPKPKAKAKTKAKAKPKAKAKSKKEESTDSVSPLINDDTIKAIEEEIDIIVCNAVQKSLVKYFKAIADKVSDK